MHHAAHCKCCVQSVVLCTAVVLVLPLCDVATILPWTSLGVRTAMHPLLQCMARALLPGDGVTTGATTNCACFRHVTPRKDHIVAGQVGPDSCTWGIVVWWNILWR